MNDISLDDDVIMASLSSSSQRINNTEKIDRERIRGAIFVGVPPGGGGGG